MRAAAGASGADNEIPAKVSAGPITIAQDMGVRGKVAGDATVASGVHPDLEGTVRGESAMCDLTNPLM